MRTTLRWTTAVFAALFAGTPIAPLAGQAFDPGAAPVWRVAGSARGTPAYDGETAYFLGRDREVVAIDARSGAVRWRTGTGVTSVDAIFGSTTAGTALAIAGPNVIGADWDVVAFDRRTGERQWTYTAPGGDGPGLFLGQGAGDTLYTGSPGGKVYALDTRTGVPRWITAVEDREWTSVFPPVVHGGRVVAGYTTFRGPDVGGLAALDAGSGRLLWRTEFPTARQRWQHTNLAGGPAIVDDLVFGSAGDGNIYAFDLASGAVRWALPRLANLADDHRPVVDTDTDHRALVRAGRLIIAGSATGYVVAYDIDTRSERWRFYDGKSGSTMFWFAADERLAYIPFFGGFIVALDLASGGERWRTGDFLQGFLWPPAMAGDVIFVGGAYAGFHALRTTAPEPRP
jgi:outer membrane protein assembly factor BamB